METKCLDLGKVITNHLQSPWPLGAHGLLPVHLQTRTVPEAEKMVVAKEANFS